MLVLMTCASKHSIQTATVTCILLILKLAERYVNINYAASTAKLCCCCPPLSPTIPSGGVTLNFLNTEQFQSSI